MIKLIQILALVLALAGIAQAQASDRQGAPADSKFDPKTARKLNPEEAKIFGPSATKYRYDARMIKAAEIAAQRARSRSSSRCWRYVKYALLDAKVVGTYPETVYAKQAAAELSRQFGFKKLASVKDPYRAPVGAVLVYGGRGAGHVEIRTRTGFVSDFASRKPSTRPFLGAFVLPKS